MTISITVLRSGGTDEHGDRAPGGSHVETGFTVAPRRGAEDTDRGEVVIVGLTLTGPFEADIRASDTVRIDDPKWAGTYDVVGEPGRWQNPFSNRRAGIEVALTRTG